MRIGVPIWNDQVSPVLDAARSLLVIDLEGDDVLSREIVGLGGGRMGELAGTICRARVDALLCGAVSEPLLRILGARGVQVVPWVTGCVDDVVTAFARGRLDDARFAMPGCRGRRHRGGRGRRGRCD